MTPSGERSSWSGNEGSSRAKGAAKGAERASLGQVCPPGASAPGGGRAGPWLGDRVPGWRRTRPGSAGSGPRARPPGRAGRASRAGRPGGGSLRCAPAPASLAPIPCGLFEPDGGAVTRSARSRRVGVGPGAGRARTTSEHDPSRDPPHAVTGCSDTEPHPVKRQSTPFTSVAGRESSSSASNSVDIASLSLFRALNAANSSSCCSMASRRSASFLSPSRT